ncbi:MAG: hypothetical protein OHK0013_17880 [Sandaracinaceae bacterium]
MFVLSMTPAQFRASAEALEDSGTIRSPAAEIHGLEAAGLSDEAILLMLSTRLRDLDGQIGQLTRQLQNATAEAQRLGVEVQRLQAVRELLGQPHMVDNGNLRLDERVELSQLEALANRLGIDARAFFNAFARGGEGEDRYLRVRDVLEHISINGESLADTQTVEQLQRRSESLGEALRQCNSGNEQAMVRLQSVMQQRTQAVTMATNMLKANDEARDAVVGNLR